MAIVSWLWTLWRHVTPCIPVNISQTTVAAALNDTNGRLTCCGFMHKTDISNHVVLLLAEETPNAYKTKSAMTGAAGKLNISCRSGSGSNVIIARRQAEYIWINQEPLRQRWMEVPASFHRQFPQARPLLSVFPCTLLCYFLSGHISTRLCEA